MAAEPGRWARALTWPFLAGALLLVTLGLVGPNPAPSPASASLTAAGAVLLAALCAGMHLRERVLRERMRDVEHERDDARAHGEHLAAALERQEGELEATRLEFQEFADIAGHDLSEPLRGISNYARFLLEDHGDALGDEGTEMLEALPQLCRRLKGQIDALLEYSRVSKDGRVHQPIELDGVLDEVVDELRDYLDEHHVEVERAGELPTSTCVPERIGEVFRHLLRNAVQFNEAPEKRIQVGTTATPQGPAIYVSDNGIGIPEASREAVFALFRRLHGKQHYGGGPGAGLTLTKKIVELHDGAIWIDAPAGEGTRICFTLHSRTDAPESSPPSES